MLRNIFGRFYEGAEDYRVKRLLALEEVVQGLVQLRQLRVGGIGELRRHLHHIAEI